ncbi:MAG: pyridoxal phosphate-dependent class II aminotransferase [Synergistaceae bacterium]|jgi:threonine-phosphate decarboxylase|nr:pyridoxal phosphate-dependent class II aminotransferase [Synergistaceae bacterium]
MNDMIDMNMPPHGANPDKLYRFFGIEMPERILDFSVNANVLEWDGSWDFPIKDRLSNYPDDECLRVRELIASSEGCSIDNVLVTNGSNEGIYLIASHFSGRRASFMDPLYSEYRRAAHAYGVIEVQSDNRPDLFFICNPCNPTGDYIDGRDMKRIVSSHRETLFAVDEAYIDFLRRDEKKPLRPAEHPNLIILRSLTKIYHLSGARIGYLLASEEWVRRLRARQPSWSVNSLAQAAAVRFLEDGDFVPRTRSFYAAETPRFMSSLAAAGFEMAPSKTNFFIIRVRDDAETIAALLRRGIIVRHTRNFKGLDGKWIRVATRTPEDNDCFVESITEESRRRS